MASLFKTDVGWSGEADGGVGGALRRPLGKMAFWVSVMELFFWSGSEIRGPPERVGTLLDREARAYPAHTQ